MNRQEHLKLLEKKMAKNLEIARKKNNDYCGVGVEVDPFKNFRISEQAGVPVEKGILVRMYDKMSRISSLLSQEAQVNDESVQDTLHDLSNYSLILSNYLDSKRQKTGSIVDTEIKEGDTVELYRYSFVNNDGDEADYSWLKTYQIEKNGKYLVIDINGDSITLKNNQGKNIYLDTNLVRKV